MSWTFWLYLPGAVSWTACLLLYGLRSPWFRSRTGRVMFATFASLAAVLLLAALLRVMHLPFSLAVPLVAVTLGAVDLAGLVQLANILRLQRRDRDEQRELVTQTRAP